VCCLLHGDQRLTYFEFMSENFRKFSQTRLP
jgi:hypothetical protein